MTQHLTTEPITFRLDKNDLSHLALLLRHLQSQTAFVDRTTVMRFALKVAASAIVTSEGGQPG